jgi:hypothetical protein
LDSLKEQALDSLKEQSKLWTPYNKASFGLLKTTKQALGSLKEQSKLWTP